MSQVIRSNKLLNFVPAKNNMASTGQPTLRFGCPLAKRYVPGEVGGHG